MSQCIYIICELSRMRVKHLIGPILFGTTANWINSFDMATKICTINRNWLISFWN